MSGGVGRRPPPEECPAADGLVGKMRPPFALASGSAAGCQKRLIRVNVCMYYLVSEVAPGAIEGVRNRPLLKYPSLAHILQQAGYAQLEDPGNGEEGGGRGRTGTRFVKGTTPNQSCVSDITGVSVALGVDAQHPQAAPSPRRVRHASEPFLVYAWLVCRYPSLT